MCKINIESCGLRTKNVSTLGRACAHNKKPHAYAMLVFAMRSKLFPDVFSTSLSAIHPGDAGNNRGIVRRGFLVATVPPAFGMLGIRSRPDQRL